MAKAKAKEVYQRVFFDYLLFSGIIFLTLAYITRGTWLGAFTEAAALLIGVVWSYRAIQTNKSVVFRLLAALVLVLIYSLLAMYLGGVHGQL
jgi:hypothetical protein